MKSLFGIIAILSIAGFGFYLHQEVGVWAAAALGVISVIGAMAYLVVLVMNGVRQNERDNTHETLYIGAEVFKNYATVHAAHARGNLEQVKADNKIRVLSYKEAERAAREQTAADMLRRAISSQERGELVEAQQLFYQITTLYHDTSASQEARRRQTGIVGPGVR